MIEIKPGQLWRQKQGGQFRDHFLLISRMTNDGGIYWEEQDAPFCLVIIEGGKVVLPTEYIKLKYELFADCPNA